MRHLSLMVVLVAVGVMLAADAPKLPPAASGTIDFARDIQPLFAKNCLKCHGPEKQRGGLRLDSEKMARAGGNSGWVIVPGAKAADSKLLHAVGGLDPELKMPPEGPPLSREDVGKLRAWIEQGAKWSDVKSDATVKASSSHWAFQPIPAPFVPAMSIGANDIPLLARIAGRPIDQFVLTRLKREGLTLSPEADRPTLIRRLSLDLLGLPPTPQEVDAFVNDTSEYAYEKLVKRLLDSPHYGERWGRHWLDLARYADSDGFETDAGRPWAWRFRDWIIAALNHNQRLDEFIVEQLAGDLLPNATLDQKIATGFHRNTLTNKEGGVDPEQFRVEAVIDRVNTTGKAFLGLTVGCAQCHDHKYDPISQREYYQLFAYFNSDREADIDAPIAAEMEAYRTKKAAHEAKRVVLKWVVDEHAKWLPVLQANWETGLALPELRKQPANIQAILLKEPKTRSEPESKQLANHYAKIDKGHAKLTKDFADHVKEAPRLPQAPTMADGEPRKTHVMLRGDFLRPGVEVTQGTPAVLPPVADAPGSAKRLQLARWVVSADNPLTARVIVNWVWHKYFGRGIVATLEDFGTQGEKPSHPELLDWLAADFIKSGWDLKRLHTTIVTSATYRQSSKLRPELRERDPANVLFARQSRLRLEGEIVRDVSLAASGLLVAKIGGRSVRPPQPAGISELTYAGGAPWPVSDGPDRYRRGMYTWFQRTSPFPMLMTFDEPDSNVSCVRRERSNTPLQALTLLNDTAFVECARALAMRAISEVRGTDAERLHYAFRLCLGREADPLELERLAKLFGELRELARARPAESARLAGAKSGMDLADAAAWIGVARAILNLDEFVTRE